MARNSPRSKHQQVQLSRPSGQTHRACLGKGSPTHPIVSPRLLLARPGSGNSQPSQPRRETQTDPGSLHTRHLVFASTYQRRPLRAQVPLLVASPDLSQNLPTPHCMGTLWTSTLGPDVCFRPCCLGESPPCDCFLGCLCLPSSLTVLPPGQPFQLCYPGGGVSQTFQPELPLLRGVPGLLPCLLPQAAGETSRQQDHSC